MIDRIYICGYLATAVALTLVHSVPVMVAVLVAALVLAGTDAPRILKRALIAIALVNSVVSISYALAGWLRGSLDLDCLLLVNARVLALTIVTMLAARRIDILRAASFSPALGRFLTVLYGQVLIHRRTYQEMRAALRSRSARRPTARDLYRHGAAAASILLDKALYNAGEIAQAMRSRGLLHD
ncbi:MAG: hypothetical protein FJY88_03625 [Candidatus Eisenbacteria bacterium]|nr:hypothetical protein [Candidatus Eisenbacteria bacterium]